MGPLVAAHPQGSPRNSLQTVKHTESLKITPGAKMGCRLFSDLQGRRWRCRKASREKNGQVVPRAEERQIGTSDPYLQQ